MLGRIDVKVAGFTVYSKEIGFKSVDRAIKNFTDNIEKIKSVADGSAFDAPGFFSDPVLRAAYLGAEWIGPSQGQLDPDQIARENRKLREALETPTQSRGPR